MLPTKFRFIWPSGFTGEDLQKSANQKQDLHVTAMFVTGSGPNVQSLEGFQRRRLKCEKLTDDRQQVVAKMWKVYRCWIQSVDNTSYDHLDQVT